MVDISLRASERNAAGKGAARKLRREGMVPAVLYGPEIDPKPLSLDGKQIETIIRHHGSASLIVNLEIEGEDGGNRRALVKEVQRDTVTGRILYVDLHHISATRKVALEVPVVLVGEAKGAKEGGILELVLRELEIQCLPDYIPEKVELDVTGLGIGDAIHVKDVRIPNVEIMNDPESVVATVVPPTVYEEARAEAAEEEAVEEKKEEVAEESKEEGKKEKEKEKE